MASMPKHTGFRRPPDLAIPWVAGELGAFSDAWIDTSSPFRPPDQDPL